MALIFNLFQDKCTEAYVGHPLTGVVFKKSDLFRSCPTFSLSRNNRTYFDELLPPDNATLDWIKDIPLLVLNGLLD